VVFKENGYNKIVTKMAIKQIRKRDGRIVDFDEEKIAKAIWKAAQAVGGKDPELSNKLAATAINLLAAKLSPGEVPTVEQVQDSVEKVLVEGKHYLTAKAYILYRRQHDELRELKGLFSNLSIVEDYVNEADWRVKENANMTFSLQGLNFHISSIITSQYWLNKIYPKEIQEAHLGGDFHIHDLGILGAYCVGWDLKDLLLTGFRGVRGKVDSKPAKHFRTALGQIVNFFYTLQGEAAGAQAFSNFDTLLAPFIKYDDLSRKQVKQALQEFIFNINVPTRVGFQTPFTNVSLDLKVPKFMENEPVIHGGEIREDTYKDFQDEVILFNEVFAEVLTEGDADGRVFTFPIPTYSITSDFDWDNPAYDKIWEMTAKYGIPYFSNFINSDLDPEDVRSMCCHLRLDKRELQRRGGGLFGANPLTGSIGVVTINMARLGYLSENEEDFITRLDALMDLAKESLEIKRKTIEAFTEMGLYPYSKFYLRHTKEGHGTYWNNHFSTIGVVGMNEAVVNFMGKTIGDPEGLAFSEKVLEHIRDRLSYYQENSSELFNLEATPAEGTSHSLARKDAERFPDMKFANGDAVKKGIPPYYTNSSLLPVSFTDDLFEALSLQDGLQAKYTGGTVFHVYLGEAKPPVESVKQLVKTICSNYSLPYFTITPTFSICPSHGYIFGEHYECPECKVDGKITNCEIYSRVVGYLRPVDQWNDGKRQEFNERKIFDSAIGREPSSCGCSVKRVE